MHVSFVVPAFNEAALLPRTLNYLRECCSILPAGESEIIVCDNNSTDITSEIARDGGATVVFEPHNQIASARNKGAEAAQGDWLIFVDADTLVPMRLFQEFLRRAEDPQLIAGGATLRSDGDRIDFRVSLYLWNLISRLTLFPAGSFLFVRKDAFQRVGGFPGTHYAGEELGLMSALRGQCSDRNQKFCIIATSFAVTSERKAKLYSAFAYIKLVLRVLWTRGGSLKKVDTCAVWYDGRR